MGAPISRGRGCTDFREAGHYLFEDEADAINALVPQFLAAQPAIQEHVG